MQLLMKETALPHSEIALHYAKLVIEGTIGRHEAYTLMRDHIPDFGNACTFIDLAIGELKSDN